MWPDRRRERTHWRGMSCLAGARGGEERPLHEARDARSVPPSSTPNGCRPIGALLCDCQQIRYAKWSHPGGRPLWGDDRVQAFLTAWTSIRTLTLSPTSRPPLSSAAFQFKANSRRLTGVSAVNPAPSLPNGFLPRPL